ncbi:MAG TPA: TetR family transcriptional regulator [Alphaproteobacteria bacterium]|nr:TetR family transcriptional regulator [Alphaproteobacteria bacterium]
MRTKSFDPETVLRKAMQLFWRQGYEATSMDDLVRAMGINRASLYATFGDKRRLFIRALDLYGRTALAPRLAALAEAPSPLAALRALLAELVAFGAGDPQRRGCLAVNAACELGGRDPEIAARLRALRRDQEAHLARLLARARDDGEISPAHDPQSCARLLATVIDGLRVEAKRDNDADGPAEAAAALLALIE